MNRNSDQFAPSISPRVPDAQDHPATTPRAYPAAGEERPLFQLDLKRSLQMHRQLALGFALAGLILAALYLARYWSMYTAESMVYIQPTPAAVLEGPAPMHWPYNYDPATYDSYVAQQMLSMKRPDVLVGALHKLDPGTFQQSGESDESAAERLKGAFEVAREQSSYQVSIAAHASNPDMAAAIANAIAASYIENTKHEQKAGDAERLAMLKDERDRVKKELDDDRTEQAALNAQLGVAAIGAVAPEHYDTDIAAIHDELVKARADHDEAAARLTTMNSGGGAGSPAMDAEADRQLATDPGLASLKTALEQQRAALVQQMAKVTPNNPQYKEDAAELQKIDASLDSSTLQMRARAAARIEEQLKTDLDRTSGLEARLNGQLAQMTKAAATATPKLQRASDLASDIARLQTRYNTVDEQFQNQTLEDNAPGTAHLAEVAVAPLHRSLNGVIRNAMVLLLLFALLGLAAAMIAHKMDPRVYAASEVEQLLGFAPMAQLPDFDEVPDEVADEHLLRLAAGIEYASRDGGMRACIFTGTGSGAGVTTLVTRLRDALRMLGRNAVLVNASGAAPVPPQAEEDAWRSTRSTALMQPGSETKESSPEKLPKESLVLTDAAPLTVSAEAEYMARCADCTFLVIEAGVTTREQLRAAAATLRRLNPAAVGLVLNRVGLKKADPQFRRAVNDVARHLRDRNRVQARPAPRKLHLQAEAPGAVPEPQIAAKIEQKIAPKFAAAEEEAASQFAFAAAPAHPAKWREDEPIQELATARLSNDAAPTWAELLPPEPVLPELPRNLEPISKLFTGPFASELPGNLEPISRLFTRSFVPKPAPQLAPTVPPVLGKAESIPNADPAPAPEPAKLAPQLPIVAGTPPKIEPVSKLFKGPVAPDPAPRPTPAVPPLRRRTDFISKQDSSPEPERAELVQQAPIAPKLPRELEPLADLFTGPHAPKGAPLVNRTWIRPELPNDVETILRMAAGSQVPAPHRRTMAAAPTMWRGDQPASKVVQENAPDEAPFPQPGPIRPAARSEAQPRSNPVSKAAQKPALGAAAPPVPPPASALPEREEEVPWWLAEPPVHSELELPRPGATRMGSWDSILNGSNGAEPAGSKAQEAAQKVRAKEEPPHVSRLRGILLSLGIKDSDSTGEAEFLPSKLAAAELDDESHKTNGASTRSVRSEPLDEADIPPFRQGPHMRGL